MHTISSPSRKTTEAGKDHPRGSRLARRGSNLIFLKYHIWLNIFSLDFKMQADDSATAILS